MEAILWKAFSFYIGNVIAYFVVVNVGVATGCFIVRKVPMKDVLIGIVMGFIPVLNVLSIVAMLMDFKFAYDQRKWRKRQDEIQARIEMEVV